MQKDDRLGASGRAGEGGCKVHMVHASFSTLLHSTFSTLLSLCPYLHASNLVANIVFSTQYQHPVAALCSVILPPTL